MLPRLAVGYAVQVGCQQPTLRLTDPTGLIQPEALPSHECAEIGAGGISVLPRLVFRPPVKRGSTPAIGAALAPVGPRSLPSPIITCNFRWQIALPIAIAND